MTHIRGVITFFTVFVRTLFGCFCIVAPTDIQTDRIGPGRDVKADANRTWQFEVCGDNRLIIIVLSGGEIVVILMINISLKFLLVFASSINSRL